MDDYPFEVIWLVLQQLDHNTILRYCRTSKFNYEIINIKAFWIQKSKVSHDIFNNTSLAPDQRYLQLITNNYELARGSERFLNPKILMCRAIRQNRKDIIEYLLSLGFNDSSLILQEYAAIGNISKVNYYLFITQDYNAAAYGALVGCQKDLFDLIRLKEYDYDWDLLVSGALYSEDKNLFIHVLSLLPNYSLNWQQLAECSILLGNRVILDHILLIVINYEFDWTRFGYMAAASGNLDMFDYIRSLMPFNQSNWIQWVNGSMEFGNIDFFNYIQSLGYAHWKLNWTKLISKALINNNKDLADYILKYTPIDYELNWDIVVKSSIDSRNLYLIKHILSLTYINWNEILLYTMSLKCKILFNQVLDLVPNNITLDWNYITRKASNYLEEIIW